jgi:hypothetical protein
MNAENNDSTRKTIATIDVNLVPKVTRQQWLDDAKTQHLNCVLCGTTLVFKHKVQHVDRVVHEEANCPSCRVRNRTSTHGLQ